MKITVFKKGTKERAYISGLVLLTSGGFKILDGHSTSRDRWGENGALEGLYLKDLDENEYDAIVEM